MTNKPTIVVCAYNRSNSLKRLLLSIANAIYTVPDINLIISIDFNSNEDVYTVCDLFEWKFGTKKIIKHPHHLGLKNHIISCGDLSLEYDSVIILEDDLMVSPYFYEYAKQAAHFYKDENAIAGISLYNYQVAESCFYPFKAIDDGSDVYFMQVASSWGQLWTKKQWGDFKTWFDQNPALIKNNSIPNYLHQWGQHSWKKHFIHYLIVTNKYFVFPRLSLTTNFEEVGINSSTKNVFHVTLQLSNKHYQFQNFSKSKSVYDAWFELSPHSLNQFNRNLAKYNYDVDLYGAKEIIENQSNYILTSKSGQNSLLSFNSEMFPLETNVALNYTGTDIGLFEKTKNKFQQKKLSLRNYLEPLNKRADLEFSIIIPIIQFDKKCLEQTLTSISQQAYPFLEIIIVAPKNHQSEIEKVSSFHHLKINVIIIDSHDTLDEMICLGFDKAKNELTTWIRSGTKFTENSLNHINSIFKSHVTINWINGIDKDITDKFNYDRLDVFKYRIVKGEIYKQLKTGQLNDSIEGHFFRKSCLSEITLKSLTLEDLFFELIETFQLIVVVKCLLNKPSIFELKQLNDDKKKYLLHKYHHFKLNTKIKAKIICFFLKMTVIGEESSKWYYTSLNNFPDVLRFNETHQTFYLSKF